MDFKIKMNFKNIVIAEVAVVALVLLVIRPMIFSSMKQVVIDKEQAIQEISIKLGETSAELSPDEQKEEQKIHEKNIDIHNRILASLEKIKVKLGSTVIKDADVPTVVEKITKLTQGIRGVKLVAIRPVIAQAEDGEMGFEEDIGPPQDGMGGMDGPNFEARVQTEELNIDIEVKSKYKDLIAYFEKLSALPMAFYVKSLEITQDDDENTSGGDLSQMQDMTGDFDRLSEGGSSVARRPAAKPRQKKLESKVLSISIVLTTVLTK